MNESKTITVLLAILLAATGCSPSEEEIAKEVQKTYQDRSADVESHLQAMKKAFSRAQSMTAEEADKPFDLGTRPPVDIKAYPKNGLLRFATDKLEFGALAGLKGGRLPLRARKLEGARRDASQEIDSFLKLRYLAVIRVHDKVDPKFVGNLKFEKNRLKSVDFQGGTAQGEVLVFDLTDGSYLGRELLNVRSSAKVKTTGIHVEDDIKADLKNQLREMAITEVQYWDEVNRKKGKPAPPKPAQ